ncbi:redoxin domain-containing protein [Maribacter sp. 2304DJ31-5]|uniref:redoxin domain-containing protein n=1 Tax=Maribacter sp. 2304DJ31-5 TaxID=3386273 RepID=UPI0039BC59CF
MNKKKSVVVIFCIFFLTGAIMLYNYIEVSNQKKTSKNNTSQANEISKENISLNPKDWQLINYKGETLSGVDIFKDKPLMVFFISEESCPSCVEEELVELNKSVRRNANFNNKVLFISTFKTMNEFKAFVNSLRLDSIELYNRINLIEPDKYHFAGYFFWNKEKIEKFFRPRFDDKKRLNTEFRNTMFKKLIDHNEELALYIIDGEEFFKSKLFLTEYDDSNVEYIQILNPKEGKKRYGKRGENGVYIITNK